MNYTGYTDSGGVLRHQATAGIEILVAVISKYSGHYISRSHVSQKEVIDSKDLLLNYKSSEDKRPGKLLTLHAVTSSHSR